MIACSRRTTGGTRWLAGYHEPEPSPYRIEAYVQAARSVTFMLQREHAVFADIGWYARWADASKTDPGMILFT
jgi:hypothetical protein